MPTQPGTINADYKAPGGKLLRVQMQIVAGADGVSRIHALKITGDFFMHPEEAIEDLERRLTGAPLDEAELRARARAFFAGDVQVVGASAEDVVHALLKAA